MLFKSSFYVVAPPLKKNRKVKEMFKEFYTNSLKKQKKPNNAELILVQRHEFWTFFWYFSRFLRIYQFF